MHMVSIIVYTEFYKIEVLKMLKTKIAPHLSDFFMSIVFLL